MKLLVSGCSITHGAELYNGFMSPENVKQSFSAHLAQYLSLELHNVALSGSSNEYIFHSVIDNINSSTSEVLVVWTFPTRLYWKANQRHYFFLPSWASSMIDVENFIPYEKKEPDIWITGDSQDMVETLGQVHRFFVENYFDTQELLAKTQHYDLCLRTLCSERNISYNSLNVVDIFKHLGSHAHHLTADEHTQVAKFLYKRFYS